MRPAGVLLSLSMKPGAVVGRCPVLLLLTTSYLPSISAQIVQQGGKLVGMESVNSNLTTGQGYSVAISGDGNTAIVGGGVGVWVYTRSGGVWKELGKIAPWASAVAISADGNTAVLGTGAGAAVYTVAGGLWSEQGNTLVGTGAAGDANQGFSVALSADGNTLIVGGPNDDHPSGYYGGFQAFYGTGAAWVFNRSHGVWTQQGGKLVGTGAVVVPNPVTGAPVVAIQGWSVGLSADGNTAILGAPGDNRFLGAAWVFARSSASVWTQQGDKLVGTGSVCACAHLGQSVALSGDGITAMVGGYFDGQGSGATWVFTRSAGVWTQQGSKLVGTGAVGAVVATGGRYPGAEQGQSVSLSADGNTAIIGGHYDNNFIGAAWVFTRFAGTWSQEGSKLVSSDYVGQSLLGYSVALSADGRTAIVGGPGDHGPGSGGPIGVGAAWIYQIPPPPLRVQSLTLSAPQVTGAGSLQGTITLSAAAPPGGAQVTLSASSSAVTVPAAVLVPGGSTTASFPVTVGAVSTNASASVTATYGGYTTQTALTLIAAPLISAVVTASEFGRFNAIAPGSWVEIYGALLASDSRPWASADFHGANAPTSLDGTTVTIGGQAAFLDYVSPSQINAQVPSTVLTGEQPVVVSANGIASQLYSIQVNAQQPGLLAPLAFAVNGLAYAAAVFPDNATFVLPQGAVAGIPARPAQAGDIITLYGVGFGRVVPDTPAGQIVQQTNGLASDFHLFIGGTEAIVNYAGLAPNTIGLYQFNVVMPNIPANNAAPLTITLNGVPGTQKLYVAVQ